MWKLGRRIKGCWNLRAVVEVAGYSSFAIVVVIVVVMSSG